MNKFYKNLILCGEVDYHCLLCEESLVNDAELEKHIRWEHHRKLLKDVLYLPKFKTDCIIKVGNQFYCEICNILLTTTIKTTLHVKDQSHLTKKQGLNPEVPSKSTKIVREAKHIKILNSYIVNENEWNGIIDKQCLLCDIDLDDVETHMRMPAHGLKLVQSRIEFLEGDHFYRKIEGDIFYCFVCKSPLPTSDLESHWTSQEHFDNKKKSGAIVNNGASTSKQSFNEQFKQNMKKMFKFSEKNNNTPTTNDENATISSKQQEFQKEGIDINFERSKAICRKCKFTPAYTVKAITEHIKMHKKAETNSPGFQIPGNSDSDDDDEWTTDSEDTLGGDTIVSSSDEEDKEEENKENVWIHHLDYGKIRAELAKFGKENHIRLINAGSKGYCTICDTQISAHIKNFKQHVNGARHKGHLHDKGLATNKSKKPNPPNKPEYTTKPLKSYLRNLFFVKLMDDFWINRKLCVDKHSFVYLCHLENNGKWDKIKCFLCDKTFPKDQDQAHCQTDDHRDKLFKTNVVTSIKKEFIREVRPNMFHCGYCNQMFPAWDSLKHHLKSLNHLERRMNQELVADNTDDMWGMYLGNTNSAEADIMWMQLTGNRLL